MDGRKKIKLTNGQRFCHWGAGPESNFTDRAFLLTSCPTTNFPFFFFRKENQTSFLLRLPPAADGIQEGGLLPAGRRELNKQIRSHASSRPELFTAPPSSQGIIKKLHCPKAAGVRWWWWCALVKEEGRTRVREDSTSIRPPTCSLLLFPFFVPPIPNPLLPFSPRRSTPPRGRDFLLDLIPEACRSVPARFENVPAAGHTHLPLRHHRRLLPPPEHQGRAGPLPGRRRPRRGRRRGVPQGRRAAPFQGCIGCEDRILDNGGHGKRAVPLEDFCCTTGKI